MHGIGGDIIPGLILAVLSAYWLAMIWAGVVIAVTEPAPARHRRQPG